MVLDEMINRVLLVQNAVKNKLGEEPDVYFRSSVNARTSGARHDP